MIGIQWVGLVRAMRPGGDAPLEADRCCLARSGGNRAPTERRVCFPHGVKNNGQLSGDRDTSFLEADLLGKSRPPRFQGTEPCRSRQHRRRRLIEVLSRQVSFFSPIMRPASSTTQNAVVSCDTSSAAKVDIEAPLRLRKEADWLQRDQLGNNHRRSEGCDPAITLSGPP